MTLSVPLQMAVRVAGGRAHDLETASALRDALAACTDPSLQSLQHDLRRLVTAAYDKDMATGMDLLSHAVHAAEDDARGEAAAAALALALPWTDSFWSEELREEGRAHRSGFLWQQAGDLLNELSLGGRAGELRAEIAARHLSASTTPSALLQPVSSRIRIHTSAGADYLGLADAFERLVTDIPQSAFFPGEEPDPEDAEQVQAIRLLAAEELTTLPASARLAFDVTERRHGHPLGALLAAANALRDLTRDGDPEHFVEHSRRLATKVEKEVAELRKEGNYVDPTGRLAALTEADACRPEERPTWFVLETVARLLPMYAAAPGDDEVRDSVSGLLDLFAERHATAGGAARETWRSEPVHHPQAVLESAYRGWHAEIARAQVSRIAETGCAWVSKAAQPTDVAGPRSRRHAPRPADDVRRAR